MTKFSQGLKSCIIVDITLFGHLTCRVFHERALSAKDFTVSRSRTESPLRDAEHNNRPKRPYKAMLKIQALPNKRKKTPWIYLQYNRILLFQLIQSFNR